MLTLDKQEINDKGGIATTRAEMGQLYQQQGKWDTALQNLLNAWVIFCELRSPYSELARKSIQEVREQIGEEQLDAWLTEEYGQRAEEIKAKMAADGYADGASG